MDIYRWVVRLLGNAGAVANAGAAVDARRQEDRVVALVAAHVA
jgi:hypothetical protein